MGESQILDTKTLESLGHLSKVALHSLQPNGCHTLANLIDKLPLYDFFTSPLFHLRPAVHSSDSVCWSQLLLAQKDWSWSFPPLTISMFSDTTLVAWNHTGSLKSVMMGMYMCHGNPLAANQVPSPPPIPEMVVNHLPAYDNIKPFPYLGWGRWVGSRCHMAIKWWKINKKRICYLVFTLANLYFFETRWNTQYEMFSFHIKYENKNISL